MYYLKTLEIITETHYFLFKTVRPCQEEITLRCNQNIMQKVASYISNKVLYVPMSSISNLFNFVI